VKFVNPESFGCVGYRIQRLEEVNGLRLHPLIQYPQIPWKILLAVK
jgi:hypothetical protein